jgi:hypothetical protein
VSYTLAKAENTGGSANGSGTGSESPFGGSNSDNQFDIEGSRGTASTDQPHKFVINGIANLKYGFRLSGILMAESGRPYSDGVSVPNLPFTLNGAQYNGFGGLRGLGGGGDRNIAPNTERNSTYGDKNIKVDLRLSRDFHLGGRTMMEVLLEGFNIFNRDNYNGFNSTHYDAQATTVNTPMAEPIVLTARPDFGTPNNDGSQPDGTNARRFQIAIRMRY